MLTLGTLPLGVVELMIGKMRHTALILTLATLAVSVSTVPVRAQSAGQECIQQGFKPGTAGFYHCLQGSGGSDSTESPTPESGDPASILSGNPDNAVTDFSGSSMEGATAPDPNILKQLNTGRPAGQ